MKFLIALLFIASMATAPVSCAQEVSNKAEPKITKAGLSTYSHAAFAAGCFWHEEALFERVKGVKGAISGYAGGYY